MCVQRGCTWDLPHRHPRHRIDRTDCVIAGVILTGLAAIAGGVLLNTPRTSEPQE